MAMITMLFDNGVTGGWREQLQAALQDYLENVMYPRMARSMSGEGSQRDKTAQERSGLRGVRTVGKREGKLVRRTQTAADAEQAVSGSNAFSGTASERAELEGQMEAAYSVGMTKTQALARIVLPQAMAIALPNLSGLFLGLVKGTSLAYYVGVYEITATANLLAMPALNFIEAYIMTTIIYEAISFIFNKVFRVIENNLKRFRAVAA